MTIKHSSDKNYPKIYDSPNCLCFFVSTAEAPTLIYFSNVAGVRVFTRITGSEAESGIDVAIDDPFAYITSHLNHANDCVDEVRKWIRNGADVDALDLEHGNTLLELSVIDNNIEISGLLLQHGAGVNKNSSSGRNLIVTATISNSKNMVQFLLDHGANVEAKDLQGQTALHIASANGLNTIANLLLERGADIATQDNNGMTPLHHAVMQSRYRTVRLLIDKGAKVSIQDNNDKTAWMLNQELLGDIPKPKPFLYWLFADFMGRFLLREDEFMRPDIDKMLRKTQTNRPLK